MKIACIGECMIEMALAPEGGYQMGFAGDTFNTAVYLAREGYDVSFVTVVGEDPFSDRMVERFWQEGVRTDLVFRHPERTVGLYIIETDANGERSFSYWRENSAARMLMNDGIAETLAESLSRFDLVYLSGITLAILPTKAREKLLGILRDLPGQVAFDPNFRPSLWHDVRECRSVYAEIAPLCDYVLATFDDEAALWGHQDALAVINNWSSSGSKRIVVKNGEKDIVYKVEETASIPVANPVGTPTDTTGAGDAFNAGFLATVLRGNTFEEALAHGQDLAAKVISHRGAIIAI